MKLIKTGLKDKNKDDICINHLVGLKLSDGSYRRFLVQKKTVLRKVKNYLGFDGEYSRVAITGIVFVWNGFELFPCVDVNGIPDNEKMEIIGMAKFSKNGLLKGYINKEKIKEIKKENGKNEISQKASGN